MSRQAFEEWLKTQPPENWWEVSEAERIKMTWQAATNAALERAAEVCDAIEDDKWALYKGRKPYTGKETRHASDYAQGQSDGAGDCAEAIRALKDAE